MNVKLVQQFVVHLFSVFRKGTIVLDFKRIVTLGLLIPVVLLLFIIHNFCLFLDTIIYPKFKEQPLIEPVFIISLPRTGTTYLFHSLASLETEYSSVKLWEIIFAPSIIQKKLLLKLKTVWIGKISKYILLRISNKLFLDISLSHPIGLLYPEEDESLLIWSFWSFYLNFCFPRMPFFRQLAEFETSLQSDQQEKIMSCYLRLIQRHEYVFNRTGDKKFLSKNPVFISRIQTLLSKLPTSKFIIIYRDLEYVIPSTNLLYTKLISKFFTKHNPSSDNKINKDVIRTILYWQNLLDKICDKEKLPVYKINFNDLIKNQEGIQDDLSEFLKLKSKFKFLNNINSIRTHRSKENYKPLTKQELRTYKFQFSIN